MADNFTDREFKKELASLSAQLLRDIEAHQSGLDASPAAIAERRRRVLKEGDFRFFAYTYFPHHIRGTPSSFQGHFCQRFPQILEQPSGALEWWVAPRGEAKSSLATKIGPAWCVVRGLLQRPDVQKEIGWSGPLPPFIDYVILLGAETKLPAKLIEVVKTELTANAMLLLDFPDACGSTTLWRIGEAVFQTNVKLESFGADQAIRGTFHGASRPKLLMGDDLITDAEAKSPTERQNRWNWLTKAIDYLGPPDGSVKYAGVGTVLDKDDPISRAKKTIGHVVHHFRAIERMPDNMDLWAKCEELMRNQDRVVIEEAGQGGKVVPEEELPSFRFYLENKLAMDAGSKISWPSVRSLFWLMRQRAKALKAFNTELQGDPRTDEDKIFGNITFWVQRLQHWLMFGACDPSMGANEKSDPSALLAGGFDRWNGKLHLLHAEIKRRVPSKLEADLVAMQREFRCLAIGFENNNAYEHSRQTFIKAGIAAGVPLPLVGVTATVPPEVRIDSLEPFITDRLAPSILIHAEQRQILDELDTWPEKQSHHHYDGLTALQILWMIASTRGPTMSDGYTAVPKRMQNTGHADDDGTYSGAGGAW